MMDSIAPISNHFRRWILLSYWVAMFIATHWPKISRYAPQISHFDKFMHVLVYGIWTALFWRVLTANGRRVKAATSVKLFVGGMCYAVFDELTQQLVGRTPSVSDMVADAIGILLALLILHAWQNKPG
jgi:VanZ family protein